MASENIYKLRVLVEELSRQDDESLKSEEYKDILNNIKYVFDIETSKINNENDKEDRLRCYEKMCSTIQIILNKIKIA